MVWWKSFIPSWNFSPTNPVEQNLGSTFVMLLQGSSFRRGMLINPGWDLRPIWNSPCNQPLDKIVKNYLIVKFSLKRSFAENGRLTTWIFIFINQPWCICTFIKERFNNWLLLTVFKSCKKCIFKLFFTYVRPSSEGIDYSRSIINTLYVWGTWCKEQEMCLLQLKTARRV